MQLSEYAPETDPRAALACRLLHTAPECLALAERVAVVPVGDDQTFTLAVGNLSEAVPTGCGADPVGAVFVLEPAPFNRSIAASTCGLVDWDTVISVVEGE